MKKKILSVAFAFLIICSFEANAQINKGSIFLGGQIGFSTQSSTTAQENYGFNISPVIGKAIKDNIVLGVDAAYSYTKFVPDVSSSQTTNSFGAGVFLRRYVPLGKGFYIFGQGRLGASYNENKINQSSPDITDDTKGYSIELGFYPGISYQVSKRLQLETGFNNLFDAEYQHNKEISTNSGITGESKTNGFSVGANLNNIASFTLGFRLLLAK